MPMVMYRLSLWFVLDGGGGRGASVKENQYVFKRAKMGQLMFDSFYCTLSLCWTH